MKQVVLALAIVALGATGCKPQSTTAPISQLVAKTETTPEAATPAEPQPPMDRMNGPALGATIPEVMLRHIDCRIVQKLPNELPIIVEANINTLSKNAKDYTFEGTSVDGHRFTASVWHVKTAYTNSRFWVNILMDGKPLLRIPHMDMEIFIQWTVDPNTYILHCFPPIDLPEEEMK